MNMKIATALLLLAGSTAAASAQEAISNPGRCAQFYPNANCHLALAIHIAAPTAIKLGKKAMR